LKRKKRKKRRDEGQLLDGNVVRAVSVQAVGADVDGMGGVGWDGMQCRSQCGVLQCGDMARRCRVWIWTV
jgi:hypothetical protein